MTTPKRTVICVPDGTGITAATPVHGLLSTFEGIEFKPLRFPFVDNADNPALKLGDHGRRSR